MIKKGRRGLDFSFAKPPPARMLELGFDFAVGYASVPPASPKKNWTRELIEWYRDAGIDVGMVWEMSAARPNLGATYGEIDGRAARLFAREMDWPDDIEIITACDLNSFVDNIDRHEMYVRGFHKTNEHEWIGLYGDTDILARTVGVWNIGWVPIGAWAWSGTSRADAILRAKAVGAHVLQSGGYYIDDVWAVDPNDVINDFPLWGSKTAIPVPLPPWPVPVPTPIGDESMLIRLLIIDGYDARLLAECTDTGAVLSANWSGPGDDQGNNARIQWFRQAFRPPASMPATTFEMGPFSADLLKNIRLDGQLPPGMAPELFANTDEIFAAEQTPIGTVDHEARARVATLEVVTGQLNESVGRLGQRQSTAGSELVDAGKALLGT